MASSPKKKMLFRGDVNRVYDEQYRRKNARPKKSADEAFFVRPVRRREKNAKWFSVGMGIDLPFCIIILVLLVMGTIMMFSASYAFAYYTQGDSYVYLVRQMIFIAVGISGMTVMSFFNYNKLHKAAPVVLGAAYFFLLLVLILPSGEGGVKRWIPLGIFNIQPSEIAKFAVLLFFAHWASKYYHLMQLPKYSILPGVIVFGSISALLLLEPHYSGIVIIGVLTVIMLYIGGMRTKYLAIGAAALGVIILFLAVTGGLSYAMTRMDGWGQALSAERGTDLWDSTWQTRNSLYAIGSGGLWGLGLGQSRQKFLYLPEPQNDFIFAIVVEELGLIGAAIILLIFALLVWRGITLSLRAKDKFGKLLGIGLTSQIGVQVVLNILVITDWLPNTGISLPFFSYGGSSLIMLLAQMGIILSISRTANIERQ